MKNENKIFTIENIIFILINAIIILSINFYFYYSTKSKFIHHTTNQTGSIELIKN